VAEGRGTVSSRCPPKNVAGERNRVYDPIVVIGEVWVGIVFKVSKHHPGLCLQPFRRVGLPFGYFLADLVPAMDESPLRLIDLFCARMASLVKRAPGRLRNWMAS
jgi:hypothetical protein